MTTIKKYQVCWKYSDSDTIYRCLPSTKDEAENDARENNQDWDDIIKFWVEPVPDYTPPAVTHEDDLTTAAGSPGCVDDDDLLGIPPGC